MQVERVRAGATPATARKAATTEGFAQLLTSAPEAEVAPQSAAGAEAAAALGGPMTYETAVDRVQADRQARRHGRAMLQALGALQVSMLGDGTAAGQAPACQALADLAAHMPDADDPVLRLILREIGVRAAVELARHGGPANISVA